MVALRKKEARKKSGQVWVETVVYTLIGLAIIGLLLALSKPKIDEVKDKMLIKQSLDMLKALDEKIHENQQGFLSRGVTEMRIERGELDIMPRDATISWILENSKAEYSQSGEVIKDGNVNILTIKTPQKTTVTLYLNYSANTNLTFNGLGEERKLASSPTPYTVYTENRGMQSGKTWIDVSVD